MKITLENALSMIKASEEKAKTIAVPSVVTVVDQGGHFIAVHRMDNAPIGCIQISTGKAYTAAVLKLPTHVFANLCQPGQELYGINTINGGRFIVFGGGFPIVDGDEVIGAIGCSGGTVEQDMQIAEAGLKSFQKGAV
ncbi:hypothetical protein Psch_02758 [Pelotomaculum schinkii]|uniref:Heme-binding protein n=1 Tax=Pelotomaculum schinkii TaxID=78350 RepID=A0A4Y7RBH8_9FIRM|nr:heme-binding protein [Pelotomaculum schinkii]TEB05717.1 hypothetical protein Psch_02758 [Pelotomaculum schinkii]